MKRTLIVGATTNPARYAYKAAEMLTESSHPIVPIGIKKGVVFGEKIQNNWEQIQGIDTVTLYVGPANQLEYMDAIIAIQPKRVIFNPGTENPDFYAKLESNGIDYEVACTLVLLRTNQY